MKIVELLNKIANGEEVPKKIEYNKKTYLFEGEISNYVNEYSKYDLLIGEDITALFNDKVEIIEEQENDEIKLLKLLNNVGNSQNIVEFADKQQLNNHILKNKINELIKEINKMKEGK